ncbi:MAG: hypothetical protein GWO24_21750, partial [Akkermansiaceae bacterium]|nr:hypothetical protein [Akkermansiaceae bacterium]
PDCHVQPGRGNQLPGRPTRRLYCAARLLLETYVERFASMEVDAIFLLGDTLDPATPEELDWLNSLIERSAVPIHAITGNHEVYGPVSLEEFHLALGLPPHGNHVVKVNDVPFLMLATTHMDSLAPGSAGFSWLESTLSASHPADNLFCCAHLSLLLHPCVQGWNNDGTQILWAADDILALLHRHPNVRAWIAGHKNVPSKLIHHGVLHLLSPQLIQTPCAYRLLDIHQDGLLSQVHPINEQDIATWSDQAQGSSYHHRLGHPEDRNFWWTWAIPP